MDTATTTATDAEMIGALPLSQFKNDPKIRQMDLRRGHRFQPPAAEMKRIPALRSTESVPMAEKIVHLHYFGGNADWWIVELDQESGEAFGLVDLGYGAEWGYISLREVAETLLQGTLNGRTFRFAAERDCWWTKVTAGEVLAGR